MLGAFYELIAKKYPAAAAFNVQDAPPPSSSRPSSDGGGHAIRLPSNLRCCLAATIPNGGKIFIFRIKRKVIILLEVIRDIGVFRHISPEGSYLVI